MDALTGANGRAFTRLVHLQDLIGEDTSSVDHATGSYLINRTGLLISNRNAGYFVVTVLQKPYDFRVVQDTSTGVDRAADHINRKAGIIELAVVIKHPGGHPFRTKHWNGTKRPFRADTNRTSQT